VVQAQSIIEYYSGMWSSGCGTFVGIGLGALFFWVKALGDFVFGMPFYQLGVLCEEIYRNVKQQRNDGQRNNNNL